MPAFSDRIEWGISVFHAFGHQWPCQCVYHPLKRQGFGFSDGEGCERCWGSLKKLISILRVSGVSLAWFYFRLSIRLFLHLFLCSFVRSFVRSSIRLFVHSFVGLFVRFVRSFFPLFFPLFFHSFVCLSIPFFSLI